MEKYDYFKAVSDDLLKALKYDDDYRHKDYQTFEDWVTMVTELAVRDDSVTGGDSGSYTCNSARAKEYVLNNFDIYFAACKYYNDYNPTIEEFEQDMEENDVIIRRYVLFQVCETVCKTYAASKENS